MEKQGALKNRVLARVAAAELTVDEQKAIIGGQTIYPCGDDPDKVTTWTRTGDTAPGDGGGVPPPDCSDIG